MRNKTKRERWNLKGMMKRRRKEREREAETRDGKTEIIKGEQGETEQWADGENKQRFEML